MVLEERQYFQILKQTLAREVSKNLGIRKEFKDWSLNDIRDFQADLESKCKSTISEKWFYTHFKNASQKLPRVDVLHLLSKYCGFNNWEDFKQSETVEIIFPRKPKKKKAWMVLIFIVLLTVVFGLWKSKENKVVIVFEDAFTREVINGKNLKINSEKGNVPTQETGDLIIGRNKYASLKVDGAYYLATEIYADQYENIDTLRIELFPDDYALMLNYFSRSTLKNWGKRREKLDTVLHDDATIFEMYEDLNGIDMLNKTEFIERLTLPINSLKNLEILDIVYKDQKIYKLRFVQKDK